uniref:DUF3068 domain-containing protein n=1 Tax=Janibacter limosus TaxID=53458 RepID=A0AC61U0T5_9MICO|nr:DUF3068 domain-containing protein [Janibacter limosus]
MRKYLLPTIIMCVGAFILTMGLLFKFYAYPRLAVVPTDQNTTQIVQDPDAKFFDADNVKPGNGELTTTARIIGDPEASEQASEETGEDVAIWNSGRVSDNNGDNIPMDGSTEVLVFDRHTGEAINCCGESKNGEAVKRSGLLVKFPFDTQPVDTYTLVGQHGRPGLPGQVHGRGGAAGDEHLRVHPGGPRDQVRDAGAARQPLRWVRELRRRRRRPLLLQQAHLLGRPGHRSRPGPGRGPEAGVPLRRQDPQRPRDDLPASPLTRSPAMSRSTSPSRRSCTWSSRPCP